MRTTGGQDTPPGIKPKQMHSLEQESKGRIDARSNKSSLLNCFKIVPENAPEATQFAKRQQSSDHPVPVPELVQSNNEFKVVAR